MPEPTTTAPTTPPALDPFVEKIVKDMGKILDPTAPVEPEPSIQSEGLTLGEATMLAKAGVTSLTAPAPAAPEPAPPVAPVTPADPAAPAAPTAPTPAQKLSIKRKPDQPAPITQPPVQPPAPVQPQPPVDDAKKKEEEAYVQSLTPEQSEMLRMAEVAETAGIKPGFRTKVLDYYKQLDRFIEEHPDMPVDHEEFQTFIRSNEPSFSDSEVRKVERRMAIDEAKGEILKDVQPTIQAQEREIRELRTKPIIEGTVRQVESALTSYSSDKLKDETDEAYNARVASKEPPPFDKTVVDTINTAGYERALEQFPIEAPIIQGTLNAIEAWQKISNRVVTVDPQDQTHAYLIGFIDQQGKIIQSMPKESRMLGGKDFLPMHEFINQTRKDPSVADRFYTLDDRMISEMLVSNAKIALKAKISELERAGFKREVKKVSTTSGNGTPPPNPSTPPQPDPGNASPRAGATPIPGTVDAPGRLSEAAAFIDSLVPGASKDLNLK